MEKSLPLYLIYIPVYQNAKDDLSIFINILILIPESIDRFKNKSLSNLMIAKLAMLNEPFLKQRA